MFLVLLYLRFHLGELFDKHIAEFETTINGGSYKMVDGNKLNMWRDKNNGDIEGIVKAINTHKTP